MDKLITFLFILVIIFSFENILDRGRYEYSPIEIGHNFSRREYLGNKLGRIYKNRFGLYYFDTVYSKSLKIKSILLSDLGNYFAYIPLIIFLAYAGVRKHDEN